MKNGYMLGNILKLEEGIISRKRQTMEVSYKNNIKILMLILLWLFLL
jgi:hypothetical protein